MRILIIGTIHEAVGPANSVALEGILFDRRPDVVFLEMPPDALDDHFGGQRSNLESTAVGRYRTVRNVELVPVDLSTPPPEFFNARGKLHSHLKTRHFEYHRLVESDLQYVERHGFEYLNSWYFRELQADLERVTASILRDEGDSEHARFHAQWLAVLARRDHAMLENIRAFCAASSHENGVFLVGAAHLPALARMTEPERTQISPRIQWEFFGTFIG